MTLFIVVALILCLALIVFYRTFRLRDHRRTTPSPALYAPRGSEGDAVDERTTQAVDRFRQAIRFATVTPGESEQGAALLLDQFQEFLAVSYPSFHAAAERTSLGSFGVTYRWPGLKRDLRPVLLVAHYDVVPVEASKWSHPPFAADLVREEGVDFVYGRGALDTKNTLIAIMESCEALAISGFRPSHDVYIAFGGDEELNGTRGARVMAHGFAEQGIHFAWVHDEGGLVSDGSLPGITTPLAVVGVDEKGYTNLTLAVVQPPGHSSRPPHVQAAAVLGRALSRLEWHPFPLRLIPSVRSFFEGLVPFVDFGRAVLLANLWLFRPLFFFAMSGNPTVLSLLQTTLAMTMLSGGTAANVLPDRVEATLNLRLLPGWSVPSVLERVRRAVGDDRVAVSLAPGFLNEEPVVGRGVGPGFQTVKAAVEAAFPGVPVLPYLTTGQTDSRHYAGVADEILRFAPMRLTPSELDRIHGNDERISVENFISGIRFYEALLRSV
ncbi:MAG TPA: M20/M25/M40 family metallo-hydrolase [Spirochaetia bacterium]|nr:M20/M25/M40 family metallo-hydrolase [Spirochaetia bacterium]